MTEPEYRFIKGEGWVATYGPCELIVSEYDVQPGDIILGWLFKGHKKWETPSVRYVITRIDGRLIRSNLTQIFHEISDSGIVFKVLRD